jgi:multiple sugar transport system ATP-binding protein
VSSSSRAGSHRQPVVSLDPNSRLTEGQEEELWFDPSKIHYFDPTSGDNLTRDLVGIPA